MRHKVTLYDTLGVERDATDKQIRETPPRPVLW